MFQSPSDRGCHHRPYSVGKQPLFTLFQSPSDRGCHHRAVLALSIDSCNVCFSPLRIGVVIIGTLGTLATVASALFQSPSDRGCHHREQITGTATITLTFQSPSDRGCHHRGREFI